MQKGKFYRSRWSNDSSAYFDKIHLSSFDTDVFQKKGKKLGSTLDFILKFFRKEGGLFRSGGCVATPANGP